MENIRMSYGERADAASNAAAADLFRLMAKKKTNLAFSADLTDPERLLSLTEQIGHEIAVLKTHIDIVNGFTPGLVKQLQELSRKHEFLIFEDGKLADIGNTVAMQYSEGIFRIADWANLINVHIVPGPGVITGIGNVIKARKDGMPRGILLLAQMSSEGNLATGKYTEKAVEFANQSKDVVAGYIGNGGNPVELRKLSGLSLPEHVIMTPGINLDEISDSTGQRYGTPESAVLAGSDCIIVGRSIYKSEDPAEKARTYREVGWNAYLKRIKGD